jgi:signal transduction histidine kinase
MTIKSRLVITSFSIVAVLLVMGAAAVKIGAEIMESSLKEANSDVYSFLYAAEELDEVMERLTRSRGADLERKLEWLRKECSNIGISIAVYMDDATVDELGVPLPPDLEALVFASKTGEFVSTGTKAAYIARAEGYTVVLFDTAFSFQQSEFDNGPRYIFTVLLLTVLVITFAIVIYNMVLSRFVFRHITNALGTLESGVNTIRDGDLACRIRYRTKDEFFSVCEAFNEMAGRLLTSVQSKQRDEESRRQLIAGISHDLRTPLTSIKAYAESLADNVADSQAKRDKYINTIKMKADDMEKLIQQLFLFSKLETSEFPMDIEIVGINKEISATVDGLKEEFEQSGIDIALHTEEAENFVRLDRLQFRNAVYNILDNSRKYKSADRGRVVISIGTADGRIFLTVSDNGPGVPGEALEKLFDVFYRADSARSSSIQGSGLGLAITAKIIKQLGGNIYAKNNADMGLSIIITLPLYGDQYEEKNTGN